MANGKKKLVSAGELESRAALKSTPGPKARETKSRKKEESSEDISNNVSAPIK